MVMAQHLRSSSSSLSVFLSSCLVVLLLAVAVDPAAVRGDEDRLTPEEVELVGRFREVVKDLTYKEWMTTDDYLVRWLRVRNNNLQSARDLLANVSQKPPSNNNLESSNDGRF